MPVPSRCAATAILVLLGLFATGCPQFGRVTAPPQPTPPAAPPAPRIEARANPIFRLVVPPRPLDQPTRLVAMYVRIENVYDRELVIRPDRIRFELPDGSRRTALDEPRAAEILRRSAIARYEIDYLDDQSWAPSGGLTAHQLGYWTGRVRDDLLPVTQLPPQGKIEGFVVVDTGSRFESLQDTFVEAITQPARPPGEQQAVRFPLGAPIGVGP